MDAIGTIESRRSQVLQTWRPFAGLRNMFREMCHQFPDFFQNETVPGFRTQTRAEEKSRKSEYRFSKVFDESGVGMFMIGMGGTITLVNNEFCRMVGYLEEELLGRCYSELNHPYEEETENHAFVDIPDGRNDQIRNDKCYKRKTGEMVWAILDVVIVRDRDGKAVCIIGQTQDLTDLRKTDVLLKKIHNIVKNNMPTISSFRSLQALRETMPKSTDC